MPKAWFGKVFIAADHGGFRLKEALKRHLQKRGIPFEDLGTDSEEAVDYPDFALKGARMVAAGSMRAGILVCGTGIGMCIAANKVRGIRAALCWNTESARLARGHNNANVLCLGGRLLKQRVAEKIADAFLSTQFSKEERHRRRVRKIDAL